MKQYLEEASKVLTALESTENGLSSEKAAKRLGEHGKNRLKEAEKESLFKKFIASLADPMIVMLLGAALIQAVVAVVEAGGKPGFSDFAEVIVILAVVVINTVMGLVQESKAEAAMDALMEMTAATSKVLRDGEQTVLKSEELVPGDVIVLEAGDAVPADCRILEAHSMKVEESALTGESVPVTKLADVLMLKNNSKDVSLGDRKNMLYSGSTVVYGRGRAVVTATGMDTEIGKIADALSQAEKEQTPLQKKMAELSKVLTKLVIYTCIVVFVVGIAEALIVSKEPFSWALFGKTGLDTFVAAIALAVAAIPEGMPAVVTIILSIGVTSMSKRRALIRKLTAVETLGCTQIICSDKTGTLTQNRMTVVDAYTPDRKLLAKCMALCSDAEIRPGEENAIGEPTECALVNDAFKLGMPSYELVKEMPRVAEAPFDSMRKMMSTVHESSGKYVQFTKGATDMLVARCTHYLSEDGTAQKMTAEKLGEIAAQNKAFADRALRVLCGAYRCYDALPMGEDTEPEKLEQDLVFIGLVGMIDPCRPEVYDAIKECRRAGIRPIMITGDHRDTAVAIGKDLGIITDASESIEGAALDAFTDEQLIEEVPKYSVYARVQPEHKTRIVRAWKARGMVTAMTGDGVNDAPSIKASDIGIGMGITGTDVTKGAADMVLADDNFATIVSAVEEGRKIYDNMMKVLRFQLSSNMSEVLVVFLASLFNFTVLSPVHLLWVNMVTDSLPGLALGMEQAEGNLMDRKPRSSSEGIFTREASIDMVWRAVYIGIAVLAAYFIGYRLEIGSMAGVFRGTECANAMAMAFVTLNFSELFCAFTMRSRYESIFSARMLKNQNWWLTGAFAVGVLLTLAAIYVPGLNTVFHIKPGSFSASELAIAVALSVSVVPVFEIGKRFIKAAEEKKAAKA